ncbi:DNAJC17 [Cordylochernes scorpioides]|uniref:DNAJC17 n=1 Tax=Cordylochernes scorpioides TaxID=51811 RepID=A0ABY6KK89_9ARAC|nr:DNAJC17 [Cordylochernes scorpioides]
MSSAEIEEDVTKMNIYEFLSIEETATNAEIKSAYRKQALKCHPDKNPDNPKAAKLFLQLTKAFEILSDEEARKAYDSVLQGRKLAALRHQELDSKRRKLKDDLERREQEAINIKVDEVKQQKQLEKELERLKKEGKKLIEEEQERLRQKAQEIYEKCSEVKYPKIRAKWNIDKNDDNDNGGYTQNILEQIFEKYGNVTYIIIPSKRKGSALIEFNNDFSAINAFETEKGLSNNPLSLKWIEKPNLSSRNKVAPKDFDAYEAEVLGMFSK